MQALQDLTARFRQSLAVLRKKEAHFDLEAAQKEVADYLGKGFPIYVAESEPGSLVGYLVCRVDEDVVWAESLYVLPEYRRQGIGSELYAQAEKLVEQLGSDTLYNWIDPGNEPIIRFLVKRGYNVLNLVELRRARNGEELTTKIQVGRNEFNYH